MFLINDREKKQIHQSTMIKKDKRLNDHSKDKKIGLPVFMLIGPVVPYRFKNPLRKKVKAKKSGVGINV